MDDAFRLTGNDEVHKHNIIHNTYELYCKNRSTTKLKLSHCTPSLIRTRWSQHGNYLIENRTDVEKKRAPPFAIFPGIADDWRVMAENIAVTCRSPVRRIHRTRSNLYHVRGGSPYTVVVALSRDAAGPAGSQQLRSPLSCRVQKLSSARLWKFTVDRSWLAGELYWDYNDQSERAIQGTRHGIRRCCCEPGSSFNCSSDCDIFCWSPWNESGGYHIDSNCLRPPRLVLHQIVFVSPRSYRYSQSLQFVKFCVCVVAAKFQWNESCVQIFASIVAWLDSPSDYSS